MFLHGKIPKKLICKTRNYKVKMLLSGWPSSQREDVHQQENDQVLGGRRRLFAWWHWGSTWPFCTYLVSRWQILKNDISLDISAFWQLGTSTGSAWRPKSSTWATTGESGAMPSPFKVEKRKLLEKMTPCFQDNTRDQRRWSKIISFSTTAILKGWKSGKRWET